MDAFFIISTLIKIIVITFLLLLPMIAYSVYAERRVSAIIQDRVGPNRVGFQGLLQPIADGIKFLLKEEFTPGHVRKGFFILAPILTMAPALITVAVIPFGSDIILDTGRTLALSIAQVEIGPLFIFAIASISVYGIAIAGWASNSKYAYFGSVRSAAQMISYEIALGLSIIPVLMLFSSFNLNDMIAYQAEHGWLLLPISIEHGLTKEGLLTWFPMLIAFIIFTVSIFAETNRMPFDLPECETELVGGYHTEYSSMKFALFFLGEYAAMIVGSAVVVTIFLGGWSLPFGLSHTEFLSSGSIWAGLIHIGCFLAKLIGFIIFFIWVRWSIPRFRYDQLMKLGWVVFFELALVNVVITAVILYFLTR